MHRITIFAICLIVALGSMGGSALASDHHRLSTAAELQAALAQEAQAAEILLAPGDYGILSISNLERPSERPLILRSADPANPARFSRMTLNEVQNVTLDGVVFDYTYQVGDKIYLRPFQVLSSTGVTIRNSLFDGDLWRGGGAVDDGFPTGFGLGVRSSSDITLKDNEIRGFFRGMVISQSQNVIVRGNDLHSIRMDGMNFAGVVNLLIEKNHIHDFARSLESQDHADMIQFWTNGTETPSRDIIIRDNLLNSGQGWHTQSIFIRNEEVDTGRAGHEMFYRNITIENNLIINAHLHGISVGETDGLIIRNNTVVRNAKSEGKKDNPTLWIPQIRVNAASRNVLLSRNITSKITGYDAQPDWRVENNVFVQDRARGAAGFYGQLFDPLVLSDPSQPKAFLPKKGGALDGARIGAQQPIL